MNGFKGISWEKYELTSFIKNSDSESVFLAEILCDKPATKGVPQLFFCRIWGKRLDTA